MAMLPNTPREVRVLVEYGQPGRFWISQFANDYEKPVRPATKAEVSCCRAVITPRGDLLFIHQGGLH